MKKVAIRFIHAAFSEGTLKSLGITNFVKMHKEPDVYEVHVDDIKEFEKISDKVEESTGMSPRWFSMFSVNESSEMQAA